MASAHTNHFDGSAPVFADIRAAEEAAALERNSLAARTVANHALDAADCGHLLAVLGLDLSDLK